MLASAYGRTDHRALLDLAAAVDRVLLRAGNIRISCPLGTDLSGAPPAAAGEPGEPGECGAGARRQPAEPGEPGERGAEAAVRWFPMGVHRPVEAAGFSGRVVLAGWLASTGSKVYEPASLALESPVAADVASGRLVGLHGEAGLVDRVRAHYRMVADEFGLDPGAVHSWHAGIHPGCAYPARAAEDPDRWANNVFTNPRFVHFHTCGALPPGEICWTVLDPTIEVDGTDLWRRGRLRLEAFAPLRDCLSRWPALAPLFADPSDAIGLAGAGLPPAGGRR